MFVSRKTRYALRALVDLGLQFQSTNTPVRLHEIAKRQQISTRYLENIFNLMADSNIIKGIKGKRGGFVPSRPPEEIDLSQIIMILENPGREFDCITGGKECILSNNCNSVLFWKDYFGTMDQFFKKYTLADLMRPNTPDMAVPRKKSKAQ